MDSQLIETLENANNQTLTRLCSLSFCNQVMTKYAHWWSWSCDLHGCDCHIDELVDMISHACQHVIF